MRHTITNIPICTIIRAMITMFPPLAIPLRMIHARWIITTTTATAVAVAASISSMRGIRPFA